jgi:ABC-type transporter Mla subunit MlaD
MAEVTEQLTRMERLLERTHDLVQEVAREQARMSGTLDQMDKRLGTVEQLFTTVETRLDHKASTALVVGLITLLGAWSALLTLLPRWLPQP